MQYFRNKSKGRIHFDYFISFFFLLEGVRRKQGRMLISFKLVATDKNLRSFWNAENVQSLDHLHQIYSKHSCIPGNSFMLQTRNFSKLTITWFKTGNFHPNVVFSSQVLVNAVLMVAVWWISFRVKRGAGPSCNENTLYFMTPWAAVLHIKMEFQSHC